MSTIALYKTLQKIPNTTEPVIQAAVENFESLTQQPKRLDKIETDITELKIDVNQLKIDVAELKMAMRVVLGIMFIMLAAILGLYFQ